MNNLLKLKELLIAKRKLFIFLVSLSIIVFGGLQTNWFSLFRSPTAYAVGDLIVDWGIAGVGDVGAIFNISNWAPGQSETRTVNIENGAPNSRAVAIKGNKTNGTGSLEQALEIIISSNGSDIYGGTNGTKTVKNFFDDSSSPLGIFLFTLNPGADRNIDIKVKFMESAGNEYQNKNVVFNIVIGVTVELPAECSNITFNNVIVGTAGNDRLNGGGGNQVILGLEGNDKIDGGGGNDCIIGGTGVDTIDGGAGSDVISGEEGNDKPDGGAGNDFIYGGLGNDNIEGGAGDDNIKANEGNDNVDGGAGNDTIDGGSEHDILKGGAGNDTIIGAGGTDTANGNTGVDTCSAESRISCEF